MIKMKWSIVVPLALVAGFAIAQAPAIKRTILQKGDVPVEGAREVIMGTAEIAAGGATGRHSHNGPETGYVLEGTSLLEIDGDAPKMMKAGDSYFIAAGKSSPTAYASLRQSPRYIQIPTPLKKLAACVTAPGQSSKRRRNSAYKKQSEIDCPYVRQRTEPGVLSVHSQRPLTQLKAQHEN